MRRGYVFSNGSLREAGKGESPVFELYENPNDAELALITSKYGANDRIVKQAFDPKKATRLEFNEKRVSFSVKRPLLKTLHENAEIHYKLGSAGIFISENGIAALSSDTVWGLRLEELRASTVNEILLALLRRNVDEFESHLDKVEELGVKVEKAIFSKFNNKTLKELLALENWLVLCDSAIGQNQQIIEQLKIHAGKLNFTPRELEELEQIGIENQQNMSQTQIFYNHMNNYMSARISIVSNNLNFIMKSMSAIGISIAIPSLFACIGGMSEFSNAVGSRHLGLAYTALIVGMTLSGVVIYWVLDKVFENK